MHTFELRTPWDVWLDIDLESRFKGSPFYPPASTSVPACMWWMNLNPVQSMKNNNWTQIGKRCKISVEEENTDLERQEIQQRIEVLEKKQESFFFAFVVFLLCSCGFMYVVFFSTPMLNLFVDSIFLMTSILMTVIMFYRLNQLKHEIFEISHTLR